MEVKIYSGLSKWRIYLCGLLQTVNTMFLMLMMFAQYIATGSYGIAVVSAGLILSLARVWDAVTDPLIAMFLPRMKTPFGVIRPMLVLGYLIMVLSVGAMFWIFPGTGTVSFVICLFIYYIGYTIMNQANALWRTMVTNDPSTRPLVARGSQIFGTVITLAMSLLRARYLFPKYGSINLPLLQELAIMMFVIGGIFTALGCFALSPIDKAGDMERYYGKSTHVGLKDIWHLIKDNRAYLGLVIASSTDKIAGTVSSNTAVSTLLFGVVIANYQFSGDISIYGSLATFIGVWLITGLSRKIGNMEAYVKMCWAAIILFVAGGAFMLLIDPTLISQSIIPTVIFVVLYASVTAFKSAGGANVFSIKSDIADYEYYLHDKYMPALVNASEGLIAKCVDALSATVVSVALALIGYVDTMPQPGDPMSGSVMAVVLIMWLGMPVLGYVASILGMKLYPFNKEKLVEIQKVNAEKRAKNAVAYDALKK